MGGCQNGGHPELEMNLGKNLTNRPSDCQAQCRTSMQNKSWTEGCWILPTDGNCYCRKGILTNGSNSGFDCTDLANFTWAPVTSKIGGRCIETSKSLNAFEFIHTSV